MSRARRHPAVLFAALALVSLAACPEGPPPIVARPPPPTAEPKTALPPAREDGRLPALATPIAYRLSLTIDPRATRFSGRVEIDVDVPAPTSYVVLHGHALAVKEARAVVPEVGTIAARATTRPAHGHTGQWPEELVLDFDRALPKGRATIALAWDAPFDDELSGIYRVAEDGRWYAFSQFEATDARRAFPCFDEPGFKTPFEVDVHVPPGMVAFANAPEAGRDADANGTRFRFGKTKPLPTYLVAIAVGELDVREASRGTEPRVRIITTKGKTQMSDLALEATSAIVDSLAQWFGIPYPYEKLDIVAVPDFSAGAMENAGLVTFREELLLLDPARASVRARRSQALVVAHELAHQWFGDLVTAAWWDDLWLNEGMAEWMESRIVDRWRPQWGTRIDAVVSATSVMDMDALATARAVRQPVTSTSEANEAFDGITYEKGAAVLSTIEQWVGPEAFQRGVRAYLEGNAYASVHADKLFSALDRASGKDVSQMAALFLDKPGVPVVYTQLSCERGARWNVELTQEVWRPLGSKAPEDPDRTWMLPVCVSAQGEKKPLCAELAFGAPSLVAGRGCPAWIHPNAAAGYYRFVLPEPKVIDAANAKLDVSQRVTLLSNAWAAVRAGKSKPESMIKLVSMFDDDPARQVVDQIGTILYGMSDVLVEDEARAAFKKLVLGRFTKRKKTLGWQPQGANAEASGGDEAYLRRTVLYAMGELAEDDTTLAEAEELAKKWLADPKSVDADSAAVALDLASRRAGEARVDELLAAAKNAKTREDRIVALRALAGFDDTAPLIKALDATLKDDVKTHEMRYVLPSALARRKSRAAAEQWVRAHWDDLRKKLPGSLSTLLVRAASVGCTKDEAAERAAFYGPKLANVEGAQRPLAEVLESVSLCAELRRFGASAVTRALLAKR